MKKIGLIFFLFAAGVGFSSCSDDDPTQLSFEDVYGRPGWDTGVNANYFTFDETRLNNVEIQDLTEEESDDVVFEVKTTGADAYFFTNKALAATKGQVLTFEYKVSETITPSVQLDQNNSDSYTVLPDLVASNDWQTYSFDMGLLSSTWGSIGSSMKIGLGDKAGVTLTIRNLAGRGRTSEEANLADMFYFNFTADLPINEMTFESQNDGAIKGYGIYPIYEFQNNENSGDAWAQFLCSKQITADYNKLTFEYKATSAFQLQIFFVVVGDDTITTPTCDPSDEWKRVTFDFSGSVPGIFDKYQNGAPTGAGAGKVGQVMRLDIDGHGDGSPIYLRGFGLSR